MTVKEKLIRLVEELPEDAARDVLEYVIVRRNARGGAADSAEGGGLPPVLRDAPIDDEPDDDDRDGGLTEARAEAARGEGIPLERVKGELGL